MFWSPVLTLLILLAIFSLSFSATLDTRQNIGCYCGTLTGDSCGSRTSSGVSLSGSCEANKLYHCEEQFGNAQLKSTCLICSAGGQDGYDSCALNTGVNGNGSLDLLGINL